MIGGFQVGPFQPAYQQVAGATPTPSPVVSAGGGGLGYFRTKKGKRRFHEFFDDIVDEVKREMAMEYARASLAEMVATKGELARKELEAALDLMRDQRKRRRRRAAAIMLLDS